MLDKDMKPYTFKWGPDHRNSQELDKLYFFTDGIQLAPKTSMREWHYYFGHNPYGMEVDLKTSTDVDTIYGYLLGRMQFFLDDEKMKKAGVNAREGGEVYDYALKQMFLTSDDKFIAEVLKKMDPERLQKIIKATGLR